MWDPMVQSVVPIPPQQTPKSTPNPGIQGPKTSALPPHLNNLFGTLQDSFRRKRGKEFGTKNQERYYCDIAGCNKSYSRHRDVRRHKEKEHRIDLLGQGFTDWSRASTWSRQKSRIGGRTVWKTLLKENRRIVDCVEIHLTREIFISLISRTVIIQC